MKHALVTGGSGYIGLHLIRALLEKGVAVRATARTDAASARIAGLGAETAPWSLDDAVVPPRLLDGIDTLFHLAAPRRVYNRLTETTSRTGGGGHREGSARLAAAAAASGITRMVITSSGAVYGKPWGEIDETAPTRAESDYGRDRIAIEALCREAFAGAPQRLAIARLTETFGPGSPGQIALLTAIAEGRFRMIGSGRVLHHLSTVEDTVRGLVALAQSDSAGGTVLHIGSPPRTLRDFVSAAAEALGRPIRGTPWADVPATVALGLLGSVPVLSRQAPMLHATLDYQLRPRAFSIRRSIDLLGAYATSDFGACVAASARAIGREP